MSYSNPDNAQKLPFIQSLDKFYASRTAVQNELAGAALPAEVVSVDSTGTLVTVKFPMQDPGNTPIQREQFPLYILQLPQVEMPVATDLYGIPPLQAGDMGYCLPADYDLGGVSGYYEGPTSFTKQPNLSTLVFHPIGNITASARDFPDKYYISGPTGLHIKDLSGVADVTIGPIPEGGPANTMRLRVLINAPSDVAAHAAGVPLYGLYHNNGAVRYNYTVG